MQHRTWHEFLISNCGKYAELVLLKDKAYETNKFEKYGESSIVKNGGSSENICQISFFKVNKIHKLVNGFRDTCIESYARQLSNCDRSKRCRRNDLPPLTRTQEILFHISKDSFSAKSTTAYHLESNNPTASVSTVKKRALPSSIIVLADNEYVNNGKT